MSDAMYRPSRSILPRAPKPLSATPGLGRHPPFTPPFSTTPTSQISRVNNPLSPLPPQSTNLPQGPVLNSPQPQDPSPPRHPDRPLKANRHPRSETSSSGPQKDPIPTRRGASRQDGRPIRRRRRLGRRVRGRPAGGDEAVGQGQHVSVHLGGSAPGVCTA